MATWLSTLGAEVHGVALPPSGAQAMFEQARVRDHLKSHTVIDIRDTARLLPYVRSIEPEVVFHLAAQPLVRASYIDARGTFETNVLGTVNLLEAVRATNSVRVCQVITSDKCYANREWVYAYREGDSLGGRDPYSSSKACAELVTTSYAQSFFADGAVSVATVRAGNVIGGGDWAEDRVFPDLVRAVQTGEALKLRNPHAIRPWQHVLEPLRGYLSLAACQAIDPLAFAGPWNFGPPPSGNRTVEALVECAIRSWGMGTWTVEASAGSPPSTVERLHEAKFLKLDCTKAHTLLGWSPGLSFQEAVEKTVRWYRDVGDGAPGEAVTARQIAAYERRLGIGEQPPQYLAAT